MEPKIRQYPTHAQARDPILLPVAMAVANTFTRYKHHCKGNYERSGA